MERNKDPLPYLAEIYQQLYLDPKDPQSAEIYKKIVLSGQEAPSKDLSHFRCSEKDFLETVDTPAGPVPVLTLHEREDFECFLQIMANKCVPEKIPATQGAAILDGLNNWQKIRQHKEEWLQEEENWVFGWADEFKRFTADRKNFKDVLIILSTGSYSHLPASAFGLSKKAWLEHSYIIRKYHECTHFFCRRNYPEQISAVWDEIVADAVGILAAFGTYDVQMERVFLGVKENGYCGGRLENYVENKKVLDAAAVKVWNTLEKIDKLSKEHPNLLPFDLAMLLEEKQKDWWEITE